MKENPFQNSEITNILVVDDLDKSKHFYLELLGAELLREYGGSSIVLKFLGHWMLLVTGGGPTEDKPLTTFVSPLDLNMVSHSFTIRVDDCERSYEILKNRGVNFITPPVRNGPETRCFFRDPSGHLFEISAYQS